MMKQPPHEHEHEKPGKTPTPNEDEKYHAGDQIQITHGGQTTRGEVTHQVGEDIFYREHGGPQQVLKVPKGAHVTRLN